MPAGLFVTDSRGPRDRRRSSDQLPLNSPEKPGKPGFSFVRSVNEVRLYQAMREPLLGLAGKGRSSAA